MTQVNLQEIAKKWFGDTLSVGALEIIKMAMRESCEQAIDLCVQASREYADNEDVKQSILNVKTKIV